MNDIRPGLRVVCALFVALMGIVLLALALAGTTKVSAASVLTGDVYYVRVAAIGDGSGESWANATTLQDALDDALSGDEIWVAKGLYKPTTGLTRTISFELVPGVAVYGGFDPDGGRMSSTSGTGPTISPS